MWILFALLSALCFAIASMVQKFSISKVVRDQRGIIAVHVIAAMCWISIVWIVRGRSGLGSNSDIIWALTSGVLMGAGALFYFKAFHIEDASVVTLLNQAIVPFTLLAGFLFLSDKVGGLQVVAAAIIIFGVSMASWSRKGFHLRTTAVIPVMLGATLLTTAVLIISKYIVDNNEVIAYTFYQTVGFAIFGILLTLIHPATRRGFKKNMHPFHPKMLLVIVLAEFLYVAGMLAQLKAFTYANAGLVLSVCTSEIFLAILFGLLLTKTLPHMINEKIDRKTLGRKFVAGVLIASGIVMLNFVN